MFRRPCPPPCDHPARSRAVRSAQSGARTTPRGPHRLGRTCDMIRSGVGLVHVIGEAAMQGTIDKSRLIWPQLAGLYEIVAPYSYALIRFAAGTVFMYHGYAKLFAGFAPVVAKNI